MQSSLRRNTITIGIGVETSSEGLNWTGYASREQLSLKRIKTSMQNDRLILWFLPHQIYMFPRLTNHLVAQIFHQNLAFLSWATLHYPIGLALELFRKKYSRLL